MAHRYLSVLLLILVAGCSERTHYIEHVDAEKLFTLMPSGYTGIDFENRLHETQDFNVFTYRNYHNGGGVAIADFNNDGLADIFFTANQGPNRLYLNEGDFRFRDVTAEAGVGGRRPWSTGVTVADVNGDGWLDIYVSAAGDFPPDDRANELFINQGRAGLPLFRDEAEAYGVADRGYSIQGAFFDYDGDGDLDLYVLNNSPRPVSSLPLRNARHVRDLYGGDRLYRNDSDSALKRVRFTDVSEETGIMGSEIAFGLDITVLDFNRDNHPDIYISNDFFERDYLYENQGDGTFREVLDQRIRQISLSSMGADAADLDKDGYPEIFVTDMLPATDRRMKMTSTFESWDVYVHNVENGFHHQFMRNTLQRNEGDGTFTEIGQLARVEATDWSWGTLLADFDLDGHKEIFVTNGVFRDVTDQDFIAFLADEDNARDFVRRGEGIDFRKLTAEIPSHQIPNHFFRAAGVAHDDASRSPLQPWDYVDVTSVVGLDQPSFSSGTAYGDLDNDGDLDLVVNNVNQPAFIYRNETTTLLDRTGIRVRLEGEGMNRFGIGAHIEVAGRSGSEFLEQMPTRGFQSSVDYTLVAAIDRSDSAYVIVQWPDGRSESRRVDPSDSTLVFRQAEADTSHSHRPDLDQPNSLLVDAEKPNSHRADSDNPFSRQMQTDSPNARQHNVGHPATRSDETTAASPSRQTSTAAAPPAPLFLDITNEIGITHTHRENEFVDFHREPLLVRMLSREGPRAAVGDVNGDGLSDIFIGGAKEQAAVLFLQRPGGRFERANVPAFEADAISEDVGAAFFDADGDGDQDLYVASGGSEYSDLAPALLDRLYLNDGSGNLTRADGRLPSHYISSSVVAPMDFDGDGHTDLFVGGRLVAWRYGIPPRSVLLRNDGTGRFTDVTESIAPELARVGMVTDAVWTDYDGDGRTDLVVVGDWMPVTIFADRGGRFSPVSAETLGQSHGWWNSVAAHDLDGDGRPELIAGNLGLNTRLRADADRPLSMLVHDFNRDGFVEQIITYYNGPTSYPLALRSDVMQRFPFLEERFPTYASYAGKTLPEIFEPQELEGGLEYHAYWMASSIIQASDDRAITLDPLPQEAQIGPIYAALAFDATGNGQDDLFVAGNFSGFKPEIGNLDAGRGLLLVRTYEGEYIPLGPAETGIRLDGDVRDLKLIDVDGRGRAILVVRNNGPVSVYAAH